MIHKYDPINSKYIHRLIVSNAIIALASVIACLVVMYHVALNENQNRLKEVAQNQARMIESISRFDYETQQKSSITKTVNAAWEGTLKQIQNAHSQYEGFGKTGEFTLAKRVNEEIIFLLSHRHSDLDKPKPVKFSSQYAQPMRAALNGNSGVMVGIDYRGEKVVAAYEPVYTPIGSLGIVAKIDLDEVRKPFLVTGLTILFITLVLMLWVSKSFFKLITPMVEQQKESIEALEKSEKLLSTIFDNSSIYMIVLDDEANIYQFNSYAVKTTGYEAKEVLGKNWFEVFISKDNVTDLTQIFSSLVKGEQLYSENVSSIVLKDGATRTIRWRNSFYTLDNRKYILSAGIDITKNLELELKYKNLYQSMRDGFTAIDLAYNIIEVNSAFCTMLGYAKEELLQKNLENITTQEQLLVEQEMLKEYAGSESTPVYEKEYICKDGSILPVELRVSKLRDSLGQHIGYWALVRDISARKKIAAELHDKEEMMISQSRQVAMGDMVAMIAHQWRQPITTVTMVANNIIMDLAFSKEIGKKELEEEMQKIVDQTEYLSKTIDDFRNFFNPSNNKTTTSLCDILDDTLKIIGKSLHNNNITLDIKKSTCPDMEILSKEMLQVLLVILNNAKDAIVANAIENGQIDIEVGSDKNSVFMKICDNGGGIKPQLLTRLGEPYLTTKVKHGTGLGLYMSNIIIQKHLRGTLAWYNHNDGACIEIRLPLI